MLKRFEPITLPMAMSPRPRMLETSDATTSGSPVPASDFDALRTEVEQLRADVASLKATVARLSAQTGLPDD